MFVSRCSSFCSIVPCSFESILMPKSLVQESYMLLPAVTYQNLVICYFCCNWCVHLMSRSSTCVLMCAMPSLQMCMPCIFVIYVVTSTSMQTRLRDVSDFRDFVISPSRFLPSLKHDNRTCYVYMLAIISSAPFWLTVSKGLLSYAFIRTLPCLDLLC